MGQVIDGELAIVFDGNVDSSAGTVPLWKL